MKKTKFFVSGIVVLLCSLSTLANAQKGKAYACNCFLPDYGCKSNDKKCASYCYRACELGFLAIKDGKSLDYFSASQIMEDEQQAPLIDCPNQLANLPSDTFWTWKNVNTLTTDQEFQRSNKVDGLKFLKISL